MKDVFIIIGIITAIGAISLASVILAPIIAVITTVVIIYGFIVLASDDDD